GPAHELAAAVRADAVELARACDAECALERADERLAALRESPAAPFTGRTHLQRHQGNASRGAAAPRVLSLAEWVLGGAHELDAERLVEGPDRLASTEQLAHRRTPTVAVVPRQ